MELATFAHTVGVMELLIGIPLLFHSKQTLKWVDRAMKDDTIMRVLGALFVIIGSLVLLDEYEVTSDPEGIIRLVAWALTIKGVIWAWWPKVAWDWKKKWLKSEATVTLGGLVATAVGVLLVYAGSIV